MPKKIENESICSMASGRRVPIVRVAGQTAHADHQAFLVGCSHRDLDTEFIRLADFSLRYAFHVLERADCRACSCLWAWLQQSFDAFEDTGRFDGLNSSWPSSLRSMTRQTRPTRVRKDFSAPF